MGERRVRNAKVGSSILPVSTKHKGAAMSGPFVFSESEGVRASASSTSEHCSRRTPALLAVPRQGRGMAGSWRQHEPDTTSPSPPNGKGAAKCGPFFSFSKPASAGAFRQSISKHSSPCRHYRSMCRKLGIPGLSHEWARSRRRPVGKAYSWPWADQPTATPSEGADGCATGDGVLRVILVFRMNRRARL